MFKKLVIPSVQPKENKLKKAVKRLGKVLEWGIFTIVLLAFLAIISPYLPSKDHLVTYIITSGSMEPQVKAGSVVLVKPVPAEKVKAGDIIAFSSPINSQQTIVHRVISVEEKQNAEVFITKGDNNNVADRWEVPSDLLRGVMIFNIPYLGHPASFMRTPKGFIIFIGLPALLLMIMQIRQIKEGIMEEVEKRTKAALAKINKNQAIMIPLFLLGFIGGFSSFFGGYNLALAKFFTGLPLSGFAIHIKDFVPPPPPTLLSPANDLYRNTSGMVMDWSDVSDFGNMSPPVYYIYQSARNSGFSPLVYQSGKLSASQIPAPGMADGKYWWRVKACDQLDNCSSWSAVWTVTVDNIKPSKPVWLAPPNNSYTNQSQNILFDWTDAVDINLAGYEYENTGPGGTWKSVDYCGLLTTSQIPNSQIGPGGSCINAPAGTLSVDAAYTRKVRAVDLAGNKSDWSDSWTVTRDTVLPQSSFISPVPNIDVTGEPITISGQSTDNYGVASTELLYTRYIDDACGINYISIGVMDNSLKNTPFVWPTTLWYPPDDGSFCLKAEATDLAGNREGSPIVANITYRRGPKITMSLSSDKKILTFSVDRLSNYARLTYTVTYDTDDEPQGDKGTIILNGEKKIEREITLGTCSSDVCTYYSGVKNFKLQIELEDSGGNKKPLETSLP